MKTLPKNTLGPAKLEVSTICLGGWPLGGGMGAIDEKQAIRVVHAALDNGINFIDTAEGYRTSESIIGQALAGRRDDVILATKLSGEHSSTHIRTAIENSLRQLRTDYIDLYQIHYPSSIWPIAETMAELSKLKDQGKIKSIGVSNFSVEQLAEASVHGQITSAQPQYSMLFRGVERDLLPYCLTNGIGTMVYGPIARGLLSGKYSTSHVFISDDDRATHPSLTKAVRQAAVQICSRLEPWVQDHGYTLAQLAIAWTLAQPAVTTAICGAKTPEQVVENCEAGRWQLTHGEIEEINALIEGLSPGV